MGRGEFLQRAIIKAFCVSMVQSLREQREETRAGEERENAPGCMLLLKNPGLVTLHMLLYFLNGLYARYKRKVDALQ